MSYVEVSQKFEHMNMKYKVIHRYDGTVDFYVLKKYNLINYLLNKKERWKLVFSGSSQLIQKIMETSSGVIDLSRELSSRLKQNKWEG